MIYRKWSLLTGPATILAGICGAVIVADLLLIENNWLRKRENKQPNPVPATK